VDTEVGMFSIDQTLNQNFGCNWKLVKTDSLVCSPTDAGKELLGESAAPELYFGKAHLMEVGRSEALYTRKPMSRLEFMTDIADLENPAQYGEEPDLDSIDDEYFVEDYRAALRAWEAHLRDADLTPVALHRARAGGGRLVWIGDRAQEDTGMRGVLATLMCAP
jgi:hypothetical protein